MASAVNGSGLTLLVKYAFEVSEVLFIDLFQSQSLTSILAIDTGISVKTQIPIYGGLNGNVGKQGKTCNLEVANNTFNLSEKYWDPVTVADRFEQCYTDLNRTVWEAMISESPNPADLTNVQSFINYFVGGVVNAFEIALWREIWFSDTAIDNISNGGILENTVDVDYFNKLDGLFKQIFTAVAANPSLKSTGILATRNAGATLAAQQFTDADTTGQVVTRELQRMIQSADIRLLRKEGLQLLVTQSVFNQLLAENIWLNASFDKTDLENGRTSIPILGYEAIAVPEWDLIIADNFVQNANGARYLPHRAVFSYYGNMRVGTPATERLDPNTNTLFYDQKDRKLYLDVELELDAKLIEDNMLKVAY